MIRRMTVLMLTGIFGLARPAQSADAERDRLAVQARTFLKTYCHRCHSGEGSEGGVYDAVDHKSLVTGTDDEPAVVVPGKPGESRLWQMLEKGKMPPKSVRERPTAEEKEIIRKWIDSGAPAPPAGPPGQARRFISTSAMLAAIRDHLQKAREEDRPYLRYFTLTHLHNLPESLVPSSDLPVYRAALSKAINSLSWKPRIVLPQAVDVSAETIQSGVKPPHSKDGTVFAIDIRDLDWDRDALWQYIQAEYPYGLRYDTVPDEASRLAYNEIVRLSGTLLPFVRADWFIATATRPPLYHDLLQIPEHARTLEHRLGVDVIDNFQRDRLARAGFAKSGVSGQNRVIERHEARYGAYWKSYDFKKDNPRGQLTVFSLGPSFRNHPFADQAFEHDGGEIIFNLPNGLQGYMLVNAKDERIDVGPIGVVGDALKTSGTNEIVTGLSCMGCHKHGMIADRDGANINWQDEIRDGTAVGGQARLKVQRLYPPPADMAKLVQDDEARFMAALEKSMGPFLRGENNGKTPTKQFPEPIGEIARLYTLTDLQPAHVAAELGIEKPEELVAAVKANRKLREYGLGPLASGGRIKRQDWERLTGNSLMQRTARELELGTPFRTVRPTR